MNVNSLQNFVCPSCRANLQLGTEIQREEDEIKQGVLECPKCQTIYPIIDHIPRFVPKENYAKSFGLEWNNHRRTQLDKFNGTRLSHDHFFALTQWPMQMSGQKILEVGSGSGRYTEVALETGADVYSFDYSLAVDANWQNNGGAPNLTLFQGDIYNIPLKSGLFDRVYCRGVLQHTPDVKRAFFSLIPMLRHGGDVVIDLYALTLRQFINPRRMYRRVTRHISPESLYSFVKAAVPHMLVLSDTVRKLPLVGQTLEKLIPVINYRGVLPLNDKQILEWAILDTFDLLSPQYENNQKLSTVRLWFEEAGLKDISVNYMPGKKQGIWGRGVKP